MYTLIPQLPWMQNRFRQVLVIGTALLILGLVFRSHYGLVIVSGTSMLPTLTPGDILLVDKVAYEQGQPDRGDIVVAKYSEGLVVKRVVGLPGEKVEVKTGKLYINGGLIKEKHPIDPGYLDVGEGKLFPGDFATLGDNRAVAPVLAIHPIVTRPDILGKVILALGKTLR